MVGMTSIVRNAIDWKPAGWAMNGFIQFTLPGGNEAKSRFGSQTSTAGKDENSVIFTNKQQPAFEKLRATLDQAIAAQHQAPAPTGGEVSVADELAKLHALMQQGILSQGEFEQEKRRLLGA